MSYEKPLDYKRISTLLLLFNVESVRQNGEHTQEGYEMGTEIEEKRVWGVHTQDDNLFLKGNVIAIGWRDFGDLSAVEPTREAFKDRYAVTYLMMPG